MNNQNYTATFSVDQTPEQVFAAINNVRGWWSEEIDGPTDAPGAVFDYHYRNVHRAKFEITEFVPGRKVVWHCLDNHFDFVQDETEWKGTDVVFEIARRGDKTELRFTHIGLVPDYECYDVCSDAWGTYIKSSLRNLITTGKGQPNPIESNYTTSFMVDQSPEEVFDAINNVRGWWSEEIDGRTDQLGAEFEFRHQDLHRSTQKITEFVPGRKVVWHVVKSHIGFVRDKTEWQDTDIVFEVARKNGMTELHFTHVGLVPAVECYEDCSGAWGFYIGDSLRRLITTGKGQPNRSMQPQ